MSQQDPYSVLGNQPQSSWGAALPSSFMPGSLTGVRLPTMSGLRTGVPGANFPLLARMMANRKTPGYANPDTLATSLTTGGLQGYQGWKQSNKPGASDIGKRAGYENIAGAGLSTLGDLTPGITGKIAKVAGLLTSGVGKSTADDARMQDIQDYLRTAGKNGGNFSPESLAKFMTIFEGK